MVVFFSHNKYYELGNKNGTLLHFFNFIPEIILQYFSNYFKSVGRKEVFA